jgi:hypothetical protein
MYEKFDVYFGRFEYVEGTGGKERPTIIIGSNENKGVVYTLGIYSYRKWFNLPENKNLLYEVKDLEHAGLDRRSFVAISRFDNIKAAKLNEYKHLGRLSERDKVELYAKMKEYYNNVQIDDFLKTLDN